MVPSNKQRHHNKYLIKNLDNDFNFVHPIFGVQATFCRSKCVDCNSLIIFLLSIFFSFYF